MSNWSGSRTTPLHAPRRHEIPGAQLAASILLWAAVIAAVTLIVVATMAAIARISGWGFTP